MTSFLIFYIQRTFSDVTERDEHARSCTRAYESTGGEGPDGVFNRKQPAIDNAVQLHSYIFQKSSMPLIEKLKDVVTGDAYNLLIKKSQDNPTLNYKYNLVLFAEFYLAINPETVTSPSIIFHSENFTLTPGGDDLEILDNLEQIYSNFMIEMENYTSNGSGYVLGKIIRLDVSTIESDIIRAGSYLELPRSLRNANKGIVNIYNKDDMCLLYVLIAWEHSIRSPPLKHRNHSNRLENYNSLADMAMWNKCG